MSNNLIVICCFSKILIRLKDSLSGTVLFAIYVSPMASCRQFNQLRITRGGGGGGEQIFSIKVPTQVLGAEAYNVHSKPWVLVCIFILYTGWSAA